MDKEIATIGNPQRLVAFTDENDILFHLTESEASLLFKYMHTTNHDIYRELGEREGQLFMKKGIVRENELSGAKIFCSADWEPVSLDEVVDEICEMNYELRSEIQDRLEERGVDFMDRSVYELLVKDSKKLESMFARTEFSKEIDKLAEHMAKEAVESYLRKVRDGENPEISEDVQRWRREEQAYSGQEYSGASGEIGSDTAREDRRIQKNIISSKNGR